MPGRINLLWYGILFIVVSRLVTMALVPLMDTSEPRYAEIARIMLETGDWITPYFNYGEPFWGKPPLAFWATALSFKLFGVTEFAARLPSLLVTLALMALLYVLAKRLLPPRAVPLPLLIYAGMALSFVAAGAVLTDPFLAFGMMLSMTAFYLVVHDRGVHPRGYWPELFFVGLAIGLLAKGPVALLLTLGPLTLWVLLQRNVTAVVAGFRWWRGLAITLLLSLPWYIAAELKTPGFIDYFIVGEHFRRFLEPGWSGDLYGSAHVRPRGTIWLYGLLAAFPWSLLLLVALAGRAAGKRRLRGVRAALFDATNSYLLLWLLFPLLFFSVARNILWTYVLPALPAFSLLTAVYLEKQAGRGLLAQARIQFAAALLVPVLLVVYTGYTMLNGDKLRTEKNLIESYYAMAAPGDPLIYVESRPFSARFYSRGKAQLLSLAALNRNGKSDARKTLYFAIPTGSVNKIDTRMRQRLKHEFSNRRFQLYSLPAG